MSKKGRKPSLIITETVIEKIKELSGLGLTRVQIAHYFEISHTTLNKLRKIDKRVGIALKKGKSDTIAHVTGKLMEHINNGNLIAIMFYLKTRAKWREKSSMTIKSNVKSEKPIYKIETNDPIEASKIYQSIMTGSYNNERNRSSQ